MFSMYHVFSSLNSRPIILPSWNKNDISYPLKGVKPIWRFDREWLFSFFFFDLIFFYISIFYVHFHYFIYIFITYNEPIFFCSKFEENIISCESLCTVERDFYRRLNYHLILSPLKMHIFFVIIGNVENSYGTFYIIRHFPLTNQPEFFTRDISVVRNNIGQ